MKYDLIAIDIDGTIITDNTKISQPVAEAIQRVVDSGKKIVLCTGRAFPGAAPFMEELKLTEEGDFIITYHGALVQRTDTFETLVHHELSYEDLVLWHHFADEVGTNLLAVRNDGAYSSGRDFNFYELFEPTANNLPLRIRSLSEIPSETAFSKLFIGNNMAEIDKIEKQIPAKLLEKYTVVRSGPYSLEILNREASKGRSLKELAALLKIPQARVMAIGDSGNDIDMIAYAGLGVAMGNAIPEVKEVADVVTDTVLEDGVAKAINQYFFED